MKLKPFLHVIVMALVFFGVLSLYGYWYSVVGKESANALSLQQQIESKTQTVTHSQQAKSQLAEALAQRSTITSYFVSTNDVVPFLETLQSAGTKYGAKVAVQSVSSQPGTPHTTLQLALSITGPFDAVERTLGAIEYEPYDTAVSTVTLDTPGGGGKAPEWTASVTMNVGTIDTTATSTPPAP